MSALRKLFNLFKKALNCGIVFFSFFLYYLTLPFYAGKKFDESKVKTILVVHSDGSKIGDCVLGMSVFRQLKNNFPDAKIVGVYNKVSAPLARGNKFLDSVFEVSHYNFRSFLDIFVGLKLRELKPELAIVFSNNLAPQVLAMLSGAEYRIAFEKNFKSWPSNIKLPNIKEEEFKKNIVWLYMAFLEKLGLKVENPEPELLIGKEELQKAKKTFGLPKRFVVVHAQQVGMHKGEQWPAKNFAELLDYLYTKHGFKAVLIGTDAKTNFEIKNKMKSKVIDLNGRTSIRESAAIIALSNLFVGNASGPMHIARALKKPMAIFFGKVPVQLWKAEHKKSVSFSRQPLSAISVKEVITEMKRQDFFFRVINVPKIV